MCTNARRVSSPTGVIAYKGAIRAAKRQNAGTMAATNEQIREMRRTERLRARGIAVAVYPELLELEVAVDERLKYVSMGFNRDAAGASFFCV
jgi:hypothetical protein